MIMDKDRIEGSANQAKGAVKQAAGKITGDAKLQAEGAADKAAGKVQNAVGGVKDALQRRRQALNRPAILRQKARSSQEAGSFAWALFAAAELVAIVGSRLLPEDCMIRFLTWLRDILFSVLNGLAKVVMLAWCCCSRCCWWFALARGDGLARQHGAGAGSARTDRRQRRRPHQHLSPQARRR